MYSGDDGSGEDAKDWIKKRKVLTSYDLARAVLHSQLIAASTLTPRPASPSHALALVSNCMVRRIMDMGWIQIRSDLRYSKGW